MTSSFTGMWRMALIPMLLLFAANLAPGYLLELPPLFRPLVEFLPYAAAALAMTVALLLHQGRVFCIALLPALGYWALSAALASDDGFRATALFTAASVLLPLNLALFACLRERGLLNLHGALRLGLILLQLAALGWLLAERRVDLLHLATSEYLSLSLPGVLLPQTALAAFLIAGLILGWRLWRQQSVLDASLLLVLPALAIAANRVAEPAVPEAFLTAAGLTLLTGLILHTHRIAYRDELTGLPARRALNERLAGLGRRYTIAMLDVDHFKRFNDTYGHDVGDQVLRMVAAQLRRVRGGGKAYRYGGEEFTIVFAGKDAEHALPYLEEVREAVADYALALRAKDRPSSGKTGRQQRGRGQRQQAVSVTISIGVAERGGELKRPEAVIKAADQALYRAKQAGRNRVCQ